MSEKADFINDDRFGPCDCEDAYTFGIHNDSCHLRPMNLTKAEFVYSCEGGAKAAIVTYRWCVEEEGMTPDEAVSLVVDEAGESGACFAGIGSCGGGGCKHV